MNKELLKTALVSALVAGLVGFGFLLSLKSTTVTNVVERLGAVANIRDVGPEFGQNGLQTIVSSGSFVNSTTTIVSILNPFPATATVSFVGLFNTGVATTSYNINCGNRKAASAPRTSSNPTAIYLQTVNIATSSIFSQELRTPTTTPTYLASGEYFMCVAHGVSSNDGGFGDNTWDSAFSNPQNTFDGKFWIEFKGLIQ